MSFTGVLTVTQVSTYLKAILEENDVLSSIYVSGEISNFKNHYQTGHLYFTLKDEHSLIKCVMFQSNASKLRFSPENGMNVVVHGRVSLYERDGQYQLYADRLQPDGTGALYIAYEQLKQKLEKLGWFKKDLKKNIPHYPKRIGVVTSPTGAAVKDIVNVLQRRYPIADIILCPVQVQGESASSEIVSALHKLNDLKACDVIILGRGGGSIEELWAFNEENVAKAVFESQIPIISAVGHETDFTICDFVADLRAPTPSAAAELAVPNIDDLLFVIDSLKKRMNHSIKMKIDNERIYLQKFISYEFIFNLYSSLLNRKHKEVNELMDQITKVISEIFYNAKNQFQVQCGKLDMLSPLRVLSRGYAIATYDNRILKSINDVEPNKFVNVQLQDGILKCKIEEKHTL